MKNNERTHFIYKAYYMLEKKALSGFEKGSRGPNGKQYEGPYSLILEDHILY
jgi:hypothetical protein